MHLPFISVICLTETHFVPSSGLSRCLPHIRNDIEIDKFKSPAVLYRKNEFTCLEQDSLMLYFKSNLQLHIVV